MSTHEYKAVYCRPGGCPLYCLIALVAPTVLGGSFGCTKARTDEQAQRLTNVDDALTYPVVIKDIDRYVGRTVAWDGIDLGSYRGPKDGIKAVRENFTYLPIGDRSGGVDFNKPFMFSRLERENFRTEAAKRADIEGKDRRRLIIGTVAGNDDFKYQEGSVSKTIRAPVLRDVTVDVPVGK